MQKDFFNGEEDDDESNDAYWMNRKIGDVEDTVLTEEDDDESNDAYWMNRKTENVEDTVLTEEEAERRYEKAKNSYVSFETAEEAVKYDQEHKGEHYAVGFKKSGESARYFNLCDKLMG